MSTFLMTALFAVLKLIPIKLSLSCFIRNMSAYNKEDEAGRQFMQELTRQVNDMTNRDKSSGKAESFV